MDHLLRKAARLVVMDPDNRIFLLQYEDVPRNWWTTPGGGLEEDETCEEAAAREAMEELSLAFTTLIPLWCQTSEFTFRGQAIRQTEHYFLVRPPIQAAALDPTVGEAQRREGIVAMRWWSLEEIESTSERIYPKDLCRRLRDLLAHPPGQDAQNVTAVQTPDAP